MLNRLSQWIAKNQDIIFVGSIIAILITIFVPLPTIIIDILFVFSITLSILILLTVVYGKEQTSFSVFPSVLLLTTAYRLALDVAATRLILGNTGRLGTSAAGHVIETFGEF